MNKNAPNFVLSEPQEPPEAPSSEARSDEAPFRGPKNPDETVIQNGSGISLPHSTSDKIELTTAVDSCDTKNFSFKTVIQAFFAKYFDTFLALKPNQLQEEFSEI